MSLIRKAFQFAKKKHDATGKLYNGEAYIFHPMLTYQILCITNPADENLLCAGLLHDTLEDTDTTFRELCNEFNPDVANLVSQVTKDENKNFPNIKTERGLALKEADRMANVSQLSTVEDSKRREKLFKKYSHCIISEGSHKKYE